MDWIYARATARDIKHTSEGPAAIGPTAVVLYTSSIQISAGCAKLNPIILTVIAGPALFRPLNSYGASQRDSFCELQEFDFGDKIVFF